MSIDLKIYEELYFANDEPIPYELKDKSVLVIYPILVKDFPMYNLCRNILTIPKNEINDIEIIRMSYLEFLINVFKTNETYSKNLANLFKLCLREDLFSFSIEDKKPYIKILNEDGNVKYVIDKKDFDEISKIILYQNDINYDDRYINPEMRKAMEDYYSLKYRDIESPTFEKQRAFVISQCGISPKELKEITYRTFSQIYQASMDSEMYIAQKIIQASEKYEVKGDVMHPLFEKKKDRYEEVFQDADTFKQKIEKGASGGGQ